MPASTQVAPAAVNVNPAGLLVMVHAVMVLVDAPPVQVRTLFVMGPVVEYEVGVAAVQEQVAGDVAATVGNM